MQLQIEHQHKAAEEHAQIVHKRRSLSLHFDSMKAIQEQFQLTLANSEQQLNGDTISTLTQVRQSRERRVYSSLDVSPLEYLFILFQDRREHLGKEAQTMEQLMKKKHKRIVSDLLKEHLDIQSKSKSISQIKKELQQSLENIRLQSPSSLLRIRNDPQLLISRKRGASDEFMKKGYWKVPNEKNEEAKEFFKNVRENQIKQKQRYRQSIKKERQANELDQQKRRIQKEEEATRLKEELHRQFSKKKETKEEEEKINQQKKDEVESFLKKFKEKPPNYIIFSERYKQKQSEEEKQRSQFLALLKQSKRHSSLSEMKEDLKKYEELRVSHQMEKDQLRIIQEKKRQEIKEKLEGMYKSKIYSKSLREAPSLIDSKKVREQYAIKMQMYSREVSAKYHPRVDEQKRLQLLKNIQDLSKKEDHKIRKYKNGQQVILDKAEFDPRKIGLQYLEEVKKITSMIERKPPPTPELKQKKLVDRSLLKNTFYNRKVTISNWKQIMDNKCLSPEEKQEKIKLYFSFIQEKKIKNMQDVKKADKERLLSLRQKMDHYEIEKTEAKLALLKSLK